MLHVDAAFRSVRRHARVGPRTSRLAEQQQDKSDLRSASGLGGPSAPVPRTNRSGIGAAGSVASAPVPALGPI